MCDEFYEPGNAQAFLLYWSVNTYSHQRAWSLLFACFDRRGNWSLIRMLNCWVAELGLSSKVCHSGRSKRATELRQNVTLSVKPLKCFLLVQGLTILFGHLGSRSHDLWRRVTRSTSGLVYSLSLVCGKLIPKLQVRELALCSGNFYWCNAKYAWGKSLVLLVCAAWQGTSWALSSQPYSVLPVATHWKSCQSSLCPCHRTWTQKKPTYSCTTITPFKHHSYS